MGKETERKFLVRGDFMPHVASSSHIVQGYIARSESLTLRRRTPVERGDITRKGPTVETGLTRGEWGYEIPVGEARELLAFSRGVIDKVRYLVPVGRHTFEVDRFAGANEGLVVAEVELESEDEPFERPEWLGEEVTGDRRYYNSQLLRHPYSEWDK